MSFMAPEFDLYSDPDLVIEFSVVISQMNEQDCASRYHIFTVGKKWKNFLRMDHKGYIHAVIQLCGVRGNNKALSKASAGNQEKSLTQP
ncbi:hypothetical protein DY000_02015573 [Brassica cretica]|uniref:Stomatal closure-related actin-binding protein PH domain-containing protein n=1 Tax=Brassica cretica TaxID=69181 RepID=A0ABQ7CTU5_BRACR|nr:hypothetical protein DY000_02015578 [Brassica cretica]KAF3562088.1 hypothetical protein DY000_02015573 [Brassica cretica]